MKVENTKSRDVKVVGRNGQISLGKQFAGRIVEVENKEPGVWIVRTGSFIPDNERWLHQSEVKAKIDAGLAKARKTKPADRVLELEEQLEDESQQKG